MQIIILNIKKWLLKFYIFNDKKIMELVEERKKMAQNLYYIQKLSIPEIERAFKLSDQSIRNYINQQDSKSHKKRGPKNKNNSVYERIY